VVPNPPVTLRPQGFAPSRRFAPCAASRASFIPVPLLGFALRGLDPHAVPYAISDAGSLMGFLPRSEEHDLPLQGFSTQREARLQIRGLAGLLHSVPP
jgi:hypothetical protein